MFKSSTKKLKAQKQHCHHKGGIDKTSQDFFRLQPLKKSKQQTFINHISKSIKSDIVYKIGLKDYVHDHCSKEQWQSIF